MKIKSAAAVTVALCLAAMGVHAQQSDTPNKRKLVRELLEVMEMRNLGPRMVDSMMANFDQQFREGMLRGLKSAGKFDPERQKQIEEEIVRSFDRFNKKFNERLPQRVDIGAAMEEIAYPLYAKHFTEAELKDLIAFYRSSTGKKALQVMPQLINESMQRSAQLLNPKIFQLIEEIMEEEQRELLKMENKQP